jgi:acetolactate synthase-1/2/3 large subunit
MLRAYHAVVLAGMDAPVTFMGREGCDSRILGPDQEVVSLAGPGVHVVEALERLADSLAAPDRDRLPKDLVAPYRPPELPAGKLSLDKVCQTLAAIQPEGAIVVDEGITSSSAYFSATQNAAPHTVFTIGGGSLGWGLPCAAGAAIACPDRPVIGFQGDGSTLYTVQALWTHAREALNITTLVLSNRRYNALQVHLAHLGVAVTGPVVKAVTELEHPRIEWVKVAQGFGVPAVSVTTSEELARELRVAFAEPGPHLIEAVFA